MKRIDAIPSKSDAHRALICAALSQTPCQVLCDMESKDIAATKACLAAWKEGKEEMYCGESGSTFRFLLPVFAALGHKSIFFPEGRLSQRPLSPLYEEMERHGCRMSSQGSVPFLLEGRLNSGEYRISGNVSSQYISGLLFALPLLDGDSRILIDGKLESAGYVDMTRKVLADFGIIIKEIEEGYLVPGGQQYRGPAVYQVEGDWSNGCFWLTAGALSKEGIQIYGLSQHSLQGDRKILALLREMGAEVTVHEDSVCVKGGRLHGITIDAAQIPDMVPALAVAALSAEGTTEIRNAGRLRIKESDRLASVTKVLSDLGGQITELPDGLVIQGGKPLTGGIVDSHHDHRIVMMAAIASLLCRESVIIKDADAVNKSYPDFFKDLAKLDLGKNVERK